MTSDIKKWWRVHVKYLKNWWYRSVTNKKGNKENLSPLARLNNNDDDGAEVDDTRELNDDDDDDDVMDKMDINNYEESDFEKVGVFNTIGKKRSMKNKLKNNEQHSGASASPSSVFDGFGSGGWNDDPIHSLDSIFRNTRVSVLPLKKTNTGAYNQMSASLSRGIPIVCTTAAASGSPIFSLDSTSPPGDDVLMKSHWLDFISSQNQYLNHFKLNSNISKEEKDVKNKNDDFEYASSSNEHASKHTKAPPVLLANEAANYAKMVADVYTNSLLWGEITESAYAALKEDSSFPATIKQTAELIETITSTLPTSMASAAAFNNNNKNNNNNLNKKKGFNSFSNQVALARNSMSMKPCSSDHINNLLTFAT